MPLKTFYRFAISACTLQIQVVMDVQIEFQQCSNMFLLFPEKADISWKKANNRYSYFVWLLELLSAFCYPICINALP